VLADKRGGVESIPTLLLGNICKTSACHTERRKTKRKGMKAAIIAVLAAKGERFRQNISTLMLANIYKVPACHIERRKTKRKGMEAAIIAVLTGKGEGWSQFN
jgi:hypothetical protein